MCDNLLISFERDILVISTSRVDWICNIPDELAKNEIPQKSINWQKPFICIAVNNILK